MIKRIRKFPNLNDYITADGISRYLNISANAWKQREYKGATPPSILLDKIHWYKWADILDWIKKESCTTPKGPKSSLLIADRNYKIIERYNSLPYKTSMLKAAKLIAEEFNMKYMTVYTVIYSKKRNTEDNIKKLNESYFQSVNNDEQKVIKVDFLKLITPLERSLAKEETTKNTRKQLDSDKLPSKNGLFNKLYNMIVISDKHKNTNQTIKTQAKE